MMVTTLPLFRVMGISSVVDYAHEIKQREQLWQRYLISDLKLPAFSQTIYCVLHNYHETGYTLTIGKLASNDAILPKQAHEIWVLPQQYAVFDLPDNTINSVYYSWQIIRQNTDILHKQKIDFESYPIQGTARLYVGIEGNVEIVEM